MVLNNGGNIASTACTNLPATSIGRSSQSTQHTGSVQNNKYGQIYPIDLFTNNPIDLYQQVKILPPTNDFAPSRDSPIEFFASS